MEKSTEGSIHWDDYCPLCNNYNPATGACSEIHENVQNYTSKFLDKCSGKYFLGNRVVEERADEAEAITHLETRAHPFIFSFSGRYNRAKYILATLFVTVILFLVLIVSVSSSPSSYKEIEGPFLLISFVIFSPITVKRLHDLDKSGWYYLFFIVPGLNIIFGLFILFKKGTQGPNKYGLDPLALK